MEYLFLDCILLEYRASEATTAKHSMCIWLGSGQRMEDNINGKAVGAATRPDASGSADCLQSELVYKNREIP